MKNLDILIKLALEEDGVFNDITTINFIPKNKKAKAVLTAVTPGVLCGVSVFAKIFKTVDKNCKISYKLKDGANLSGSDEILEVFGNARSILSVERTALNFLQNLSGIATLTNAFVKEITSKKTKIYDTRKTIPAYRELAKYAVKVGGGKNHRFSLSDMVLIKDNHLALTKNLKQEVSDFRKNHKKFLVEVECENISQVKQALDAKADVIMLDNTSFSDTKKMMSLIEKRSSKTYKPEIELSGRVNFKTVKKFAALEPDRISIGMLTHSPKALDMKLEIKIF
ncbi:MAG: carboxylating nicotinate-nucleotide diphosphorylase [Elusimicrobiota bacterium]|jgi:nicotinate-nucleotide pyrophosphorylase (carboxylating)|nr:carboxylating nicotinate-nucleotide diphosphorylase [Elusimicrobiota bacterium]